MRVAVVDGQGGGMGKLVVEKLRQEFGNSITILALDQCPGYFHDVEGRCQ